MIKCGPPESVLRDFQRITDRNEFVVILLRVLVGGTRGNYQIKIIIIKKKYEKQQPTRAVFFLPAL